MKISITSANAPRIFKIVTIAVFVSLVFAARPSVAENNLEQENTLYVVAASHLDTQWWWTIEQTITDFLPITFTETFALLDSYPDFVFGWEGAFRYMLLEEYYPEIYDDLLGYVAEGKWYPAGSAIEAGDVNVPSPESLMRQFLYGSQYFEQRFGKTSVDIFLPDCFGFGYALPSVAAHFGLKGFSTQKLTWGSANGIPFGIGVWEGPDGNSIVAALNPGSYVSHINDDLENDAGWLQRIEDQYDASGLRVALRYFGTGDQGGGPGDESVEQLQQAIDDTTGQIKVISATTDQLFRDLTASQIDMLPRHNGELILSTHGAGSYTSQTTLKRLNRQNEQLADATERASIAADWLGGLPYQHRKINQAWINFLAHQFHDDLPGTSIAEAYPYSWNDEYLALNRFASVMTGAAGAVARSLDRRVSGVPLIVYNPLSIEREDVARALVRFPGEIPDAVRVFNPQGVEVPSQIESIDEQGITVLFLARVPSVGFAVYDVVAANKPSRLNGGLAVGQNYLQNQKYRVTIDEHGDIGSIYDREQNRELLDAPIRLVQFDNNSAVYPAWEILWSDIDNGPERYVIGTPNIEVIENGPVRVSIRITRNDNSSYYSQIVRLSAGDAGDIVEVALDIDWQENMLLKAEFPLAVANEQAVYDLGLGAIARGNNSDSRYEVPAQQWADLTNTDGSYGVTILNDCKYGWDKPEDNTLRLTLIHSPVSSLLALRYNQEMLDFGDNQISYALYGHTGSVASDSVWQAARFNQPLKVFQTTLDDREGVAKELSLAAINNSAVGIKALKLAEDENGYIVRLRELTGEAQSAVSFSFGNGIESAEETNGAEKVIADATVTDGTLIFDLQPYQTRTFKFVATATQLPLDPPQSRVVSLEYNVDTVSYNDNRDDGSFADAGSYALSGELFPAQITDDGLQFDLGPSTDGQANAVACQGQNIPLDLADGERVYILAAAADEDAAAQFAVGGATATTEIGYYTGNIGQDESRIVGDRIVTTRAELAPAFYNQDTVAWAGTHRHTADSDDPYKFTYLYRYVLPTEPGATSLTLPDDSSIKLFAVSLANDPNDRTVASSVLHDRFDPAFVNIDWRYLTVGDGYIEDNYTGDDSDSGCACGHLAATGSASSFVIFILLLGLVKLSDIRDILRKIMLIL